MTKNRAERENLPRSLVLQFAFLVICLFALEGFLPAEVKLSPLFSDHAVLQRDRPIVLWGTASPGERISIQLAEQKSTVTANESGEWKVSLKAMAAGGPYELVVEGKNKIVVHDLLAGEVWLASGQSNMEFKLAQVTHAGAELATANHPQLRVFTVPNRPLPDPSADLHGSWEVSAPTTAGNFTAVGYFFGLSLLKHLNVPIGIVVAAVGGTPAEAWTPLPTLTAEPEFASPAIEQNKLLRDKSQIEQTTREALVQWEKTYGANDPGNHGESLGYAKPNAKLEGWNAISVPTRGRTLSLQGAAAVWVRRDVDIPSSSYKLPGDLNLGIIHESETVYFDGEQIGASPTGPEAFGRTSRYAVPLRLLSAGKHTIALRIFAHQPSRLSFDPVSFNLPNANGTRTSLPLAGEWHYRAEFDKPLTADAMKAEPRLPQMLSIETASSLYNGEIYPLKNYPFRGVIWYQGEHNSDRSQSYQALMTHLIQSWRTQFHNEQLPFYLVQLVNYDGGRSGWDGIREAQDRVTQTVPNTALAVGIDVGEQDQIHPTNKRPIGERLALLARHRVYGEAVEDSGPVLQGAIYKKNEAVLQFSHAEGLHSTTTAPPNFFIAGADQKFYPATAVIQGTSVIVSNPAVADPVAVRYAFSQDPEGCSVYNGANLPLGPFRTDTWKPASVAAK